MPQFSYIKISSNNHVANLVLLDKPTFPPGAQTLYQAAIGAGSTIQQMHSTTSEAASRHSRSALVESVHNSIRNDKHLLADTLVYLARGLPKLCEMGYTPIYSRKSLF
jgi:hypothetical protein